MNLSRQVPFVVVVVHHLFLHLLLSSQHHSSTSCDGDNTKPCKLPSFLCLLSATTATMASRSPSPNSSEDFSPLAFDQDFTPLPEYKPAGDTALDFGGLLPAPLKVHEDLTSGCGGQTWPAGMVLARHMLRHHREDLKHARM